MSSEVGTGHVAILPTFRGLRQRTRKEIEAAGTDGGRRMERSLSRAGTRGGENAGRGFRAMFGRGMQDAVSQSTRELQQGVARAAQQVSRARMSEQDAAGKVRVAEAQLAEARKKHAADSSQVIRAEERLATATRRLETAQLRTAEASSRLTAAQDALRQAAERASRGMGFKQAARDMYGLLAPIRLVGRTLTGPLTRGVRSFATGWSNVSLVGGNALTRLGQNTRVLTAQVLGAGASVGARLVAPFTRGWAAISSGAARVGSGIQRVFAPAARWFAPFGRAVGESVRSAGRLFGGLTPVVSGVASGMASAFQGGLSVIQRATEATAAGIKNVFAGVGLAVGAALTGALSGGWRRMTSIEDAQAKLRGLGHEAETVETIMDSALSSVEGTAFGLDEAATLAASAVAAGIKPGEDLTKYLSTTANAAAAAGTSMSEMGSIMNRVQTNGRAMTQEFNQLADRGLPIWQAMADEMGVSQDAMREMVTSGEVDAETFVRVVQNMSGDVASAMGDTVSGTFRNMRTAFSRFGAVLLSPFQETFKELFRTIQLGVSALSSALAPVVQVVADSVNGVLLPVFERLQDVFSQGFEFDLDNLGSTFGMLAPILGALAGAMGPLLARLPLVGALFAGLTGPVGLLAGGLIGLFMVDPTTLADSLSSIVPRIAGFVSSMVSTIADALPGIVEAIATVLTETVPVLVESAVSLVAALLDAILTALPSLIGAFSEIIPILIEAIVTAIPLLVAAVTSAIPQIVTALVTALPILVEGAIQLFSGLVTGVTTALPVILEAVIGLIPVIVGALVAALPVLIEGAIQLFLGLVTGLLDAIPVVIEALLAAIPLLVQTLVDAVPLLLEGAIQLFLGIILGLASALPDIISALIGILPSLVKALVGMIPTLIGAAVDLFLALVKALPKAIPQILSAIADMGPELVDAVLALGPALFEAGKDILRGLGEGIASMGSWIQDKIGDVVGGAVNWAKGLLGIRSPSRVFRVIGQQTGEGYALGIESEASRVQSAVDRMVPDAGRMTRSIRAAASRVSPAGTVTSAAEQVRSVEVVQHITTQQTDPRIQARQWGREASRAFAAA